MPSQIDTSQNTIRISGEFTTQEMPRLVAAMHNTVEQRGFPEFTLDFSDCLSAFPGSMLPIVARVQGYWNQGIDISLVLPKQRNLARLFRNTNWAHLIDFRSHDESEYKGYRHVPAMKFKTAEEQTDSVSRAIEQILHGVHGLKRSDLRAIEWSINEITDNVINHSQSPVGGFLQLTNFTGAVKRIEFAVVDIGIGIPATMRTTNPNISDVEALDQAIREGVTRDKSFGQGNGLFGSWRASEISGGKFETYSLNASLLSSPKHGMRVRNQQIPYIGTVVITSIRYAEPIDISEALRFSGKKHESIDYVELNYETDDEGNISVDLSKEPGGFGTRQAGQAVRRKLSNLAAIAGDQRIIVDFSEVSILSSSYADEVFGKLFVHMGPIEFTKKFTFYNIEPVVKGLVDRAITQRVREN